LAKSTKVKSKTLATLKLAMETLQSVSATPIENPGRLVTMSPRSFHRQRWNYALRTYHTEIDFYGVNEKDTYISIFNVQTNSFSRAIPGSQAKLYETFKNHPNVKIIWESKLAVNRRLGYGTVGRNKVVVWEYVDGESNKV